LVGGEKEEARFANRRAQAFWQLRKLLEEGRLALPSAWRDQLVRELTAISWAPTGAGKIIIESKADVKARLHGASPDFADALAMAVTTSGVRDFSGVGQPAVL
jgi:hypothetical protein